MSEPPSDSRPREAASSRFIESILTALTLILLGLSWAAQHWAAPQGLVLALHLGAFAAGGWFAAIKTVPRLFYGELDVDFLMLVAALGAASIGQWNEGIVLLFLFSLSNTLQTYAMERSRRAIDSLIKRRPTEATVRRDGGERLIPVAEIHIQDIVILRPGQMSPIDGAVRAGNSDMDEASITGEARLASKAPGDVVFAGAMNIAGALEIEVTRMPEDSTLARIIRAIESAQSQKARTQRTLEAFENYYAWTVLGATALFIAYGFFFSPDFHHAFYRAMTLLVVASPCALIISTPASILSAIARAARAGILFKGGIHLENMAGIRIAVFDKTGTLTTGKPGLTDVVLARGAPEGFTEDQLVAYAAALESRSEHVLGREIVLAAKQRGLEPPAMEDFVALPGRGVHAVIEGYQVWVGANRLYKEHGEEIPEDLLEAKKRLEACGKTVLLLHREYYRVKNVGIHEARGGWLGLLGMEDTMREDAPETMRKLKTLGIRHIVMLTGDNAVVASALAAKAGIDEYHANLLPEDKVRLIQELEKKYGPAMMVGDGVNDAPALAHAAVGVAMGAAGSDVALESAPCVLMGEELSRVAFALALSRRAVRIVKANLAFSIAVIVCLVISVFAFGIPMPLGVVGHEGSTLLVCLNGLRMLGMKRA